MEKQDTANDEIKDYRKDERRKIKRKKGERWMKK